jgi:putative endonuclease
MIAIFEKKTGWKKEIGDISERLAEEYLSGKEGYRILQKNYRCPSGEIDLICQDGQWLVFVEVRSRSTGSINMAAESIGYRKQNKLKQLASYYLTQHKLNFSLCRFDAVLILLDAKKESALEMKHLKNAFM